MTRYQLVAILALAAATTVTAGLAFAHGIDGTVFTGSLGFLGALAGYAFGKRS